MNPVRIPSRNSVSPAMMFLTVADPSPVTMSFPGTYIKLKIPLNTTIRYSKPAILAVFLFGFIIWSGLEYLTFNAGDCYGGR